MDAGVCVRGSQEALGEQQQPVEQSSLYVALHWFAKASITTTPHHREAGQALTPTQAKDNRLSPFLPLSLLPPAGLAYAGEDGVLVPTCPV